MLSGAENNFRKKLGMTLLSGPENLRNRLSIIMLSGTEHRRNKLRKSIMDPPLSLEMFF